MKDEINELGLEIVDLIEKYGKIVPVYEIVNQLIINAVSCSLSCAPNELLGVKTVLACVENGINDYEKNHS